MRDSDIFKPAFFSFYDLSSQSAEELRCHGEWTCCVLHFHILFLFSSEKINFIGDDCFDLALNVSNTGLLNESFICSTIRINRANNMFFYIKIIDEIK